MVDAVVIAAKAGIVARCLVRIDTVTKGVPTAVSNIDTADIVVLNLQRAIQACIDMMAHVLAEERLGVPASSGDGFVVLATTGIIENRLAIELKRMVGFRNLAVHEYDEIDITLLEAILRDHLDDLRTFSDSMLTRYC